MNSSNVGFHLALAETEIRDPGASGVLSVDKSLAICNLVSAGAEARTLPVPVKEGVILTLYARTVVGTITLTVTGGLDFNATATFAFTAAGHYLTLQSFKKADGTLVWRKLSDYGLGDVTPAQAGGASATVANGVAAGYKVARGVTALDGSNPTPVTTGLTTVVAAVAVLEGSAAPGLGTSILTVASTNYATGALAVYAWKVTGAGDATLFASTGTENFEWVAIGT